MGAILAVIYDYWGRLWGAFIGLVTGHSPDLTKPRQLGFSLMIASLPVVVVGFTMADFITNALFHPLVVATMLILGALIIIYAEKTLVQSTHQKLKISALKQHLVLVCVSAWH